jgi:curved DNA-binding protein CbpA
MKPWEVLGVSPKATRAEITTAYRTLAYIFHPDRFSDAPPTVQMEAQRRMAQLNKAYDLAKRGRKDEVTYNIVADERAAAERMARARAQPAWQDVVRERARAEAKAKQEREARERAMTNGQARARPKSKTRSGPSVMAGIGEAVHTGKLYCRGCRSIQWLPAEWREMLASTDFFCSVCDKMILSR